LRGYGWSSLLSNYPQPAIINKAVQSRFTNSTHGSLIEIHATLDIFPGFRLVLMDRKNLYSRKKSGGGKAKNMIPAMAVDQKLILPTP
jgi:hypothetical protein